MNHKWKRNSSNTFVCENCNLIAEYSNDEQTLRTLWYHLADGSITNIEPECGMNTIPICALYNGQTKTSLLKISKHLIMEKCIIGIGPILKKESLKTSVVKLIYSLYLIRYTIQIETDYMLNFSDDAIKLLDDFRHDYNALYTAIQAQDFDIYHSYLQQKELNKKKNP